MSGTPTWVATTTLSTISGTLGVGSGGTGLTEPTHSSGAISGFGSIIVNGVRFDDSAASIVDDDGVPHVSTDLKLGMVVDVEGVLHGNRTDGFARTIQFGNEIAGPVESVDKTTGRMVVLGQVVQVDADTVFSGYASGLADVVAGNLVEVFAFYDPATSVYSATRVELKPTLTAFKLRGIVSQLSATSFAIGGATIDYGAIAPAALPQLANGLSVRVSLQTTAVAGHWVATSIRAAQRNDADWATASGSASRGPNRPSSLARKICSIPNSPSAGQTAPCSGSDSPCG